MTKYIYNCGHEYVAPFSRKPDSLVSFNCNDCEYPVVDEWVEKSKGLKQRRLDEIKIGILRASEEIGVSPNEINLMERGAKDPQPLIDYLNKKEETK